MSKNITVTFEQDGKKAVEMTENIFDLIDISDIPAEVSTGLRCDVFAQNILKLLNKAGRKLTVDEITVGYYRQFKEIKTKRQIVLKLYNMARKEEAKIMSIPHRKGVYEVVK